MVLSWQERTNDVLDNELDGRQDLRDALILSWGTWTEGNIENGVEADISMSRRDTRQHGSFGDWPGVDERVVHVDDGDRSRPQTSGSSGEDHVQVSMLVYVAQSVQPR